MSRMTSTFENRQFWEELDILVQFTCSWLFRGFDVVKLKNKVFLGAVMTSSYTNTTIFSYSSMKNAHSSIVNEIFVVFELRKTSVSSKMVQIRIPYVSERG